MFESFLGTDFKKENLTCFCHWFERELNCALAYLWSIILFILSFFLYLALPPSMGPASVIKSAALLLFLIGL